MIHKSLFGIDVAVEWNTVQIFEETLTFLVLQDMTADISWTVYFSKNYFYQNSLKNICAIKYKYPKIFCFHQWQILHWLLTTAFTGTAFILLTALPFSMYHMFCADPTNWESRRQYQGSPAIFKAKYYSRDKIALNIMSRVSQGKDVTEECI